MAFTYDPGVFDVADAEGARRIILTPEGIPTDERWTRETPYLADLLGEALQLQRGQVVLDYGCGIGRMALALIERFGVIVIGVDSSRAMRSLAYGRNLSFTVLSPGDFDEWSEAGVYDAAIAVWVLQHCLKPADDVARIARVLKPGARLGVVNNIHRAVPTHQGIWADDGISIDATVMAALPRDAKGRLDAAHVGDVVAGATFWATYRKPLSGHSI